MESDTYSNSSMSELLGEVCFMTVVEPNLMRCGCWEQTLAKQAELSRHEIAGKHDVWQLSQ